MQEVTANAEHTTDSVEGPSNKRSKSGYNLQRKLAKERPSSTKQAQEQQQQLKQAFEYDALANKGRAGRRLPPNPPQNQTLANAQRQQPARAHLLSRPTDPS